MSEGASYQRRYLRAPYKKDVLFVDDDFVFKAQSLNISEGGMLLDTVGHFPEKKEVSFMVELPQFPLFKNFYLEKFETFSRDNITSKTVRFDARLVRKIGIQNSVDGMFSSKIGLMIENITTVNQDRISQYVEVFASNLIYLQVLIDSINADENNIKKVRLIADYLGYSGEVKISYLRKIIEQDYKSLQWL